MLDLRFVTEHLDDVRAGLARRGFADRDALDRLASLANQRRQLIVEVEQLRSERNEASQQMARLDKQSPEFGERREALRTLGDRIKGLEARHDEVEGELAELLLHLPNLPHASVPEGAGEADNPVVRTWGDEPAHDGYEPKDHVDVGTALGILDFDRAAKVSGARFVVLRGLGARLERALMQLMLDVHTREHGYEEVWLPVLVKDTAMRGTGQLPKFAADAFRIARDWDAHGETAGHELYLAPTAEVPITNLHADEILDGETLPRAYTAYTACFRSEAGSYGKDTRGMIRQHQFDKVELVRFCRPEDAPAQLELLTSHAEAILQRLGLHYRVSELCAGDLGFASMKTYDLEVWLPGQQAYREISSCSWFGDFQARRMKARYRPAPKEKPRLAHTLNGSGLAIGRTVVAILEQCQQADGSVRVPEALVPYMGTDVIR
ncbi:MAG: serine--tRNA ligase [Myxococcota bacterium]